MAWRTFFKLEGRQFEPLSRHTGKISFSGFFLLRKMEEVKENKKFLPQIKIYLKNFQSHPWLCWVPNHPGRLMMSSDWHVDCVWAIPSPFTTTAATPRYRHPCAYFPLHRKHNQGAKTRVSWKLSP